MTNIRDFIPVKRLGEGSFSSVYLVRRLSDSCLYALKKVKLSSLKNKEIQNSVNEVRLLASLSPDFVIGYKESFFDQGSSILCVVMEYADGGDLSQCITAAKNSHAVIPEAQIWKAAFDVLMGLKTLHDRKILHRDLKSANVFIVGNHYKIGDLNVSKVAKNNMVHTQTGTPYYASPEVWRDQPYDAKSDIWSLGCILYQMATLKPPFRGQDMHSLFRAIQKGFFQPIGHKYSRELKDFIALCLKVSTRLRPSAQQLLKQTVMLKEKNKRNDQLHDMSPDLLKTIKVQKSLKGLQKELPKPNYQGQLLRVQKRPVSASPTMSAALINKITKQQCQRKRLEDELKALQKTKLCIEKKLPHKKEDMQYFDPSKPILTAEARAVIKHDVDKKKEPKKPEKREQKRVGFVRRVDAKPPATPPTKLQKGRIYSGKPTSNPYPNALYPKEQKIVRPKSYVRIVTVQKQATPKIPKQQQSKVSPRMIHSQQQRKREPGKISKKQPSTPVQPVWWG